MESKLRVCETHLQEALRLLPRLSGRRGPEVLGLQGVGSLFVVAELDFHRGGLHSQRARAHPQPHRNRNRAGGEHLRPHQSEQEDREERLRHRQEGGAWEESS